MCYTCRYLKYSPVKKGNKRAVAEKNTFVRNKCAVAGKKHLLATKLEKSPKKPQKSDYHG